MVGAGFEGIRIGSGEYVVELSVPQGLSTGAGAVATQHLRLVSRRPGYAPLLAGTLNPALSTAELRTYEHVALQHEVGLGIPLAITPEEYAEFTEIAEAVIEVASLKLQHVPPPPELLARRASGGGLRPVTIALALLVVALAGVVIYEITLALRH
jgi:hypothetical protein